MTWDDTVEIPISVLAGFITHNINQVLTSDHENRAAEWPLEMGCCPRCCAPCSSLWSLWTIWGEERINAILRHPDVADLTIPNYDWWDKEKDGIDWAQVENAWSGYDHPYLSGDAHPHVSAAYDETLDGMVPADDGE